MLGNTDEGPELAFDRPYLLPAPASTSTDPAHWLRVPDAAKCLGMKSRTLYRVSSEERRVPFRRVPGTRTIAFAPEDIEAIKEMSLVRPLRGSL